MAESWVAGSWALGSTGEPSGRGRRRLVSSYRSRTSQSCRQSQPPRPQPLPRRLAGHRWQRREPRLLCCRECRRWSERGRSSRRRSRHHAALEPRSTGSTSLGSRHDRRRTARTLQRETREADAEPRSTSLGGAGCLDRLVHASPTPLSSSTEPHTPSTHRRSKRIASRVIRAAHTGADSPKPVADRP